MKGVRLGSWRETRLEYEIPGNRGWKSSLHASWDADSLMDFAGLHGTLDCLTSHLSVFAGLACRSFDGLSTEKNAQGAGGADARGAPADDATRTLRSSKPPARI